jgi:hypothetical protein
MKDIKDMNIAELANKLCDLHEGDTVGLLRIADRMDKLHELTRWIPVSAKEILQVANDEKQKDWNDLKYQDVYRDGFVEGAHWMQVRIQRITPPEAQP